MIGAFNSTDSMKIQTAYPKRNKAANFVRQTEQFHQSVNKTTKRTAMTVADVHSCFLHGRFRVPIPVGIPFWLFVGFSLDTSTNAAIASQIMPHILPSIFPPFSLFIDHAPFNAPIFFYGTTAASGPWTPLCREFTIILTHTTLGRTPLDEWSNQRRDLYLTTHNTQKRQRHQCPRRDSNPQSQQTRGGRPTFWTVYPLGTADANAVWDIEKVVKQSTDDNKDFVISLLLPEWVII